MPFIELCPFMKQILLEYAIFLLLDYWAKSALKQTSCDEQKRHIWASEAQILFVGSIIEFFWYRVYPVEWMVLGILCHLSSRPPKKRSFIYGTDNEEANSLASQVYDIWFTFFVMIGNAVSFVFTRLRWNSHKEHAAESLLWSAGHYISKCFSFLYSVTEKCVKWVYRICIDWQDMLRSNQWDTYQCVSQEQIQGPPPDVSSDKLLCHPECELSQRNLCRTAAAVSGNHYSHSESDQSQAGGCYPGGTSVFTSTVRTQLDRFVGFLRMIIRQTYYSLSQCRKIRLVPYSFETSGENLCFVNAVLHCFMTEPSLRKLIVEILNEQPFFRGSLSLDETQFIQSMHHLLTQNEDNDVHLKQFVSACSKLVPSLISPPGSEQLQQDVAEFTQWMLNKLHQCFKIRRDANATLFQRSSIRKGSTAYDELQSTTVLWKPSWLDQAKCSIVQPSEALMKSLQQFASSKWISYTRDNTSLISNNFTGLMLDSYECFTCHQISAQSQTFTVLPLALTASGALSLQDAIRHFLSVENMEVNDGCSCTYSKFSSPVQKLDSFEHSLLGTPAYTLKNDNSNKTSTPVSVDNAGLYDCDAQILSPIGLNITVPKNQNRPQWYSLGVDKLLKKTWFKRTFISRAPKYLIFQLMRFQFDNKSLSKNHKPVRIPLYNLCVPVMGPPTGHWENKLTSSQKEYELCAFIVHLGSKSLSCGHYVAYIRSIEQPAIWTKYDDNVTSKVSDIQLVIDSAVVMENVYLLFYRQTSFGG